MYHSTMKIPWYIIMVGTNHYLDTKIWYEHDNHAIITSDCIFAHVFELIGKNI